MWGANEPWYANNAFHTSESTHHASSEVSGDTLLSRAKPKTVTANTGQLQGDVVKKIFDDPDNLNTPYDGFRDPWEGGALNHNRLFKTTNRADIWIPVKESIHPVGPIISAKGPDGAF